MGRGRWRRVAWTHEQLNQITALIDESEETGCNVRWADHRHTIGQELRDINTMAAKIRTARNREKQRAVNRALRAKANGFEIDTTGLPPAKRQTRLPSTIDRTGRAKDADLMPEPSRPRDIAADHRIAMSTQKFVVDTELRRRIETQGVTAGLFGDPPAGRSALDKRRAGIVDRVNNHGRTNPASPLWLKQPEAMT